MLLSLSKRARRVSVCVCVCTYICCHLLKIVGSNGFPIPIHYYNIFSILFPCFTSFPRLLLSSMYSLSPSYTKFVSRVLIHTTMKNDLPNWSSIFARAIFVFVWGSLIKSSRIWFISPLGYFPFFNIIKYAYIIWAFYQLKCWKWYFLMIFNKIYQEVSKKKPKSNHFHDIKNENSFVSRQRSKGSDTKYKKSLKPTCVSKLL